MSRNAPLLSIGLLGLVLAVAGGCSSKRARDGSVGPDDSPLPSSSSANSAPGCPVELAICDFAWQAEAALQRRDPWVFLPADRTILNPWHADAGDSIRSVLAQGTQMPRLIAVGCPAKAGVGPSCAVSFALAFAAVAGPEPGHFQQSGVVVVGFSRSGERIEATGASVAVDAPVLFSGGESREAGYTELLPSGPGPSTERVVFVPMKGSAPPFPDVSLGVETRALRQVDDTGLPVDTVLIVAHGGYGHGHGGYWEVVRYSRLGTGPMERRVLWDRRNDPGRPTNVTGVAANDNASSLYLSLCVGETCLLEGGPKQVVTEFYRSNDGGITWRKVAETAGEWWIRAAAGSSAFAVNFDGMGPLWLQIPQGVTLSQPSGTVPDWLTPIGYGPHLAWPSSAVPRLVGGDTKVLLSLPLQHALGPSRRSVSIDQAVRLPPQSVAAVVALRIPGAPEQLVNRYAVLADEDEPAVVRSLVRLDGQSLLLGGWAQASKSVFVTADYRRRVGCGGAPPVERLGAAPAILNLLDGTLAFLSEPDLCEAGAQVLVATSLGVFVRVSVGARDCLNVRSIPGAEGEALGCYAVGVLLGVWGASVEVGGDRWSAVVTPSGERGWAAADFLEN